MRMMLKVSPRGEAANKAVADGTLGRVIGGFIEQWKPEATYFTTENGQRTAFLFFDLPDVSQMPSVAEPFWSQLGATVDWAPAMNIEDLQKGIAAMSKR